MSGNFYIRVRKDPHAITLALKLEDRAGAEAAGANDFYGGVEGYKPGTGIGTLDIANFATSLQALKP